MVCCNLRTNSGGTVPPSRADLRNWTLDRLSSNDQNCSKYLPRKGSIHLLSISNCRSLIFDRWMIVTFLHHAA